MTQARDLADGTFDSTTLVVDAANNRVGIGKSTGITDKLHIENTGANCLLSVARTDGAAGRLVMQHTSSVGALQTTGSVPLVFGTNDIERMRINGGGDVSIGTGEFSLGTSSYSGAKLATLGRSNDGELMRFENGGVSKGTITVNSSSTAYNTSSDYRLKENVTADWDATTRLKQLNPVRFNFIVDPDTTVDGFLAHEVQDIVPEAITGTKDAVDDEGNPEYQGIDQSKLVPLLVKTIQEQQSAIEALEARIVALENA